MPHAVKTQAWLGHTGLDTDGGGHRSDAMSDECNSCSGGSHASISTSLLSSLAMNFMIRKANERCYRF